MKKFETELAALRQQVVEMGNLTEQMFIRSTDMLTRPDGESLIPKIMRDEEQLDQFQLDVDAEAIRLLSLFRPVAADLRMIMSISRITSELERIGDHAVNMCEAYQLMISKTDTAPLSELVRMAKVVREMLHDSLDAFVQTDSRRASATIASDDMVDAINDQITEELLSDEIVREMIDGPVDIAARLAQLLIARSLERIADQTTNISEEVVYIVRGDDIRHPRLANL